MPLFKQPPRVVKPHKISQDAAHKLWFASLKLPSEERDAWMNNQIAYVEWLDGWSRMWDYIGRWESHKAHQAGPGR